MWNRLKKQIFEKKKVGVKPIIWAEAITTTGKFDFNYNYRKDKKYVRVTDKQKFLVCNESVVLVQRTTAKEQKRRLQTCVLPQSFINEWEGVVVENHVNIIHPALERPKVSLEVISLLLNSATVDSVFRCLSGSVAVSASELHALPLPPVENLEELEEYVLQIKDNQFDAGTVEQIILRAYEIEE